MLDSRIATLIALITAVAFAILPEVSSLSPVAGKIVSIIALAGAACGKSLLRSGMSDNIRRSLIALFLVGTMLAGAACFKDGAPSRNTLSAIASAGQQIQSGIETNRDLPDQLRAAGVITQEVRDRIVPVLAEIEPLVAEFNRSMTEVLASPKPNLTPLAPLAARIASRLAMLNVVKDSKWKLAFAATELGVRFIANYFALRVRAARAAGYSDKQICRKAGIEYDREMFRALEAYAEKDDREAAAFVERYQNETTGE